MKNEKTSIAAQAIKSAILESQYQAGKAANAQMLSLYYGVGQYVSANSRKGFWGTGAIESISEQLQKELPGLRGFSATGIKRMRIFYEEWEFAFKSSTVVDKIKQISLNSSAVADEFKQLPDKSSAAADEFKAKSTAMATDLEQSPANSLAVASDLPEVVNIKLLYKPQISNPEIDFTEFLSVSFTHHMEILHKTKTIEERAFYIHQTYINDWNKETLINQLKSDFFHHHGTLANNFEKNLSNPKMALKAISTFKDEYLLDFINLEEICERDKADIDERVLEKEIIHNIKKFIMTFGKDFTFVGDQYHLEVEGHDHYSDLVFFNRELQSLVAIELKVGDFKPIYLGQLQLYLQMLDDFVKKPHENPSIGLVLCKNADKPYVEYCIRAYDKPMGVATYKTSDDMPDKLRKALPPVEELKKLLLDNEEN